MKLTKARLQKIIHTSGNQTRKKYKKLVKTFIHTNTVGNKKHFNLKNITLKSISI
jgi:hypothetical protein